MLIVIPITKNDSVLVVVLMNLWLVVDEEGCSETIDVLALKELFKING